MGKNKIPETGIYDARQLGRGRMLLLGFQHMFAMFGATILVPILTGLDVSNTLLWKRLRKRAARSNFPARLYFAAQYQACPGLGTPFCCLKGHMREIFVKEFAFFAGMQ